MVIDGLTYKFTTSTLKLEYEVYEGKKFEFEIFYLNLARILFVYQNGFNNPLLSRHMVRGNVGCMMALHLLYPSSWQSLYVVINFGKSLVPLDCQSVASLVGLEQLLPKPMSLYDSAKVYRIFLICVGHSFSLDESQDKTLLFLGIHAFNRLMI